MVIFCLLCMFCIILFLCFNSGFLHVQCVYVEIEAGKSEDSDVESSGKASDSGVEGKYLIFRIHLSYVNLLT